MKIEISMNDLCPFCEKGTLTASTRDEIVEHNGKSIVVHGFHVSNCDACQEEMVRAQEAKLNQVLIADAKLALDEKLSTGDLKCFRMRHGLNQQQAAQIFGGGSNAFSKYERGEVQQSKPMDLLIRVYDQFPEAREYLATRSGILGTSRWTGIGQSGVKLVKLRPKPSTLHVNDRDGVWKNSDIEPMYAGR